MDSDTGLVHLGYREYDPRIGRFIQPDPLGYAGGDVDVYGYCLDDPVNLVDPLGLEGAAVNEMRRSTDHTPTVVPGMPSLDCPAIRQSQYPEGVPGVEPRPGATKRIIGACVGGASGAAIGLGPGAAPAGCLGGIVKQGIEEFVNGVREQ
ncbi:RHS repeat-associated core domain-containing protein [Desulfovibrio mangrovi]|nr:RHS repeat-associated core domain-containing protein [Desulfovibrio mangrovi]UZP69164.1 RHS repeat-associated core domain-containing protein [Desulfovibrio mangrovi]